MTLLLLAQVSPPPDGVEAWLKILFWLAGGFTAVVIAFSHLTGRAGKREIQSPLEVKTAQELVRRADHEKELGEIKDELKRHAERRQRIYDEQAAQGGDIKMLKDAVAGTKDNIARVEGKIDDNTKLTAKIDGKVEQINQSVSTLTSSVTSFMRDQAKRT